ncbi:MAG: tetraacyldisaccharide 4'-kinase [Taibaiella sp.]|nr:tetraacyldisaccharide 4'-kinase [Taibaiella sp.]
MSENSFLFYIVSVLRLGLYPFTLIYGALVWLRNRMYDVKFFTSIGFSVPIISVGNLSTGGTGKTPHIEFLIDLLKYQYKVATMSRGYKRYTKGFLIADEKANALRIGDEPMQFFMKYPEVVVCVAEERLTGIPALLQRRPETDLILLDDAYQHRSVKAGLNILITDCSQPFYKDFILPFGNLREGRSAYKRANVIIVSKCPANLTQVQADEITTHINPLPGQKVFFTGIDYFTPYDFFTKEPLDIAGKSAILVVGIARPEPLEAFLKNIVADVHTLTYNDHHYFVTKDLEEIKAAYDNRNATNKIIITTEKDAARLQLYMAKLAEWGITIAIMPVKVSVLFGRYPELAELVYRYVEQAVIENNDAFGFGPPQNQITYEV